MTQIKVSSTRNHNKAKAAIICPVTYTMNKIGGYWKPIILYHMQNGPMRYSELKRAVPEITEKMLIQHLKELQRDRIVIRKVRQIMPPIVNYRLTKSGEELMPVLNAMADWAFSEMQG